MALFAFPPDPAELGGRVPAGDSETAPQVLSLDLTISKDLSQKARPDRFTPMNGYNRAAPVDMAEKVVTSPDPDNLETETVEGFNQLNPG